MSKETVVMLLRDTARTERLRAQVRQRGGRAFCLPMFRFVPIYDCAEALAYLRAPQPFAWTVFASPNGVKALHSIAMRNALRLPLNNACAAPGQGTRAALITKGFRNVVAGPGSSDLGSLLRSRALGDLRSKQVALVQRRDAPDRATVALHKRGAQAVLEIACYQRQPCAEDTWSKLNADLRRDCNAAIAFDAPSLEVLLERSGDERAARLAQPLAVIHPTIREKAAEMGFTNIIVSDDSSEIVNKLMQKVEEMPS